jgi:hypothetical protein
MKTRGLGLVYQPAYVDKHSGERRIAATWWVQYSVRGKRYRESSSSTNRADAVTLLKRRIADGAEGRPIGHDIEKTTFEGLARILLDDYQANGRQTLSGLGVRLRICGSSSATREPSTSAMID